MEAATIQDSYGVVILGGGLGSLCLSRLLGLERASVSVLSLDKGAGPCRKVGESTVEIAGHFLHSRLQMGAELYRTQLPKSGIRFWFDDEQRGLTFGEASEDGPASLSWWNTYQLERETLEGSLLELNRAAGVTHAYGAEVVSVEEGQDGAPHLVRYRIGGQEREVRARWLIDATGPGGLRGRETGRVGEEDRLPHGSCWAWFENTRHPDQLNDAGDRKRFCFTKRLLSTNTIMGEGYWIWLIPLASGLLSVGLVYDKTIVSDAPADVDELLAFLRRHRMCADVLAEAKSVQFGRLDTFAARPSYCLATQRTASLGMAGGFGDPLYSNGLDFIALQSEFIVDLIRRDSEGEDPQPERVDAYNAFLGRLYEQVVVFCSGVYKTFVSREITVPRYRRDVHIYWNLYTWPYFSRQFLDADFLQEFLPLADEAIERSKFFSRLYQHTYDRLAESGDQRRHNRGHYSFNQLGFRLFPFIRFERQLGRPMDLARSRGLLLEIDTGTFLALLDALFDGEQSPLRRLLFDAVHGDVLDDLMALEQDVGFGDAYWDRALEAINAAVHERLAERGISLPEWVIDRSSYRDLERRLAGLAETNSQAVEALAYWREIPQLDDLEDVAPLREELQAQLSWDVQHSAWDVGKVEARTIYEFLGERWWDESSASFPSAALKMARLEGEEA